MGGRLRRRWPIFGAFLTPTATPPSNCEGTGARVPAKDRACNETVSHESGYCECARPTGIGEEATVPLHVISCDPSGKRRPTTCAAVCHGGGTTAAQRALAGTLDIIARAWHHRRQLMRG